MAAGILRCVADPEPLVPHPEDGRIAAAMARLVTERRGRRFEGVLYRAAMPRFASWTHLVSGAGSRIRGSRWNPPGVGFVLHAAFSPEDAVSEALATRRRFGLPVPPALPLTLRAIRCRLSRVLDLGDGEIRQSIRVSEERLVDTDWFTANRVGGEAITQAIGRLAMEAGFEGLFVPSAEMPGSRNAVIFVDRLRRGSSLDPADAG